MLWWTKNLASSFCEQEEKWPSSSSAKQVQALMFTRDIVKHFEKFLSSMNIWSLYHIYIWSLLRLRLLWWLQSVQVSSLQKYKILPNILVNAINMPFQVHCPWNGKVCGGPYFWWGKKGQRTFFCYRNIVFSFPGSNLYRGCTSFWKCLSDSST